MTDAAENSLLSFKWKVFASLIAVAVVALYLYIRTKYGYWRKRGFPEVPSTVFPFLGHTYKLLFAQRSFSDVFSDMHEALGNKPYGGFYQGTQPILVVKDLELIKNILVKDFHYFMDRAFEMDEEIDPLSAKGLSNLKGQRWKEMRARLSPTFTSGRMKAMFPLMHTCADEFIQCLKAEVERHSGEALLEFKEQLSRFTIDVIATCAFGIQCDALKNPETSEFRRMGKLSLEPTFKRSILIALLIISPKILKLSGMKFTDDETSVFFRNFVKDMVKQREEAIEKDESAAKGYGDFIHQLVLLKKRGLHSSDMKDDSDEEGYESTKNRNEGNDKIKAPSWSNITLDDLTAQVMQFFSAGFEATSALLSFALFAISSSDKGKSIQKELREEVDRVMMENGGNITYDGLKKMDLLDRVLNETLRLYPPAGVLTRKVVQEYTIPETNLKLEKGIEIFISNQAIQRDDAIFTNAMTFDPDRFLHKEQIKQFSYLPFGDGPRICIGQRFVQMQARLGLAVLISKFEFDLCIEKTPLPLKYQKRAFLLTAESGIWLKVKERSG